MEMNPLVQQMAFDPGSLRSCGASFADIADQQLFYNVPSALSFPRDLLCFYCFPYMYLHFFGHWYIIDAHKQMQISTKQVYLRIKWKMISSKKSSQ